MYEATLGDVSSPSIDEVKGIPWSLVKKWNGPSDWETELANELHKPIKRNFTQQHVMVYHTDEIWCSDLVEMQQFSK